MTNKEKFGRNYPRKYTAAAPLAEYLDIGDISKLELLDSELRTMLTESGAYPIVYDTEAIAYSKNGDSSTPRTEPVMLHKWTGELSEEATPHPKGQNGYDTVGLRIILRGCGQIQDMIRKVLNVAPDKGSTIHCETYTFGCKYHSIEE